jgi:hypothetical protein
MHIIMPKSTCTCLPRVSLLAGPIGVGWNDLQGVAVDGVINNDAAILQRLQKNRGSV